MLFRSAVMLAVENGSGIFMYVETISMVVISAMVVIPNVLQIVSFFAAVLVAVFIILFLLRSSPAASSAGCVPGL